MFFLIPLLIVLHCDFVLVNTILIGKVSNQIYVPSASSTTRVVSFNYVTNCNECLCYALSSQAHYVVMNCLLNTRICYFYTSYSTDYLFQWNMTSNLYFFQLPPNRTTVSVSTTTTTTSTQITTTTTTTTITTPQFASSGILFTITNPTTSTYPNYTYYAFSWRATRSSATLSFVFRHDPGGWMVDDVSVYHGTTQMITNGGFETGSFTGWTYSGSCQGTSEGHVHYSQSDARTGNYYYHGTCASRSDRLYQAFETTVGDIYVISFWLTNERCCTATEIANISIT